MFIRINGEEAILETNPNIPWITKLAAVSTNYSYWRLSDIYLLRANVMLKNWRKWIGRQI